MSTNRLRALRAAGLALLLFAALGVHGAARMSAIDGRGWEGPTLRVGLVDQGVRPLDRWKRENHPAILRTLRAQTRALEAQGAELVVWPEGAYPYPIAHDARVAPEGGRAILGNGVRGPVLAGLITEAPPVVGAGGEVVHDVYNSAALVRPDGSLSEPYDKLALLWFGETVPGSTYIPWLRRTFQRSGGIIPGVAPRAIDLAANAGGPAARMAVLNCYEDTLPALGQKLATALSPTLIVNVTNDAWFYDTAEPELHARLGAMRAIELRRDVVRAVNLGVSSWIDAAGVVRARHDGHGAGTLLVTPALRDGPLTFYARHGDAPLLGVLAAAAIASWLRARRRALAAPTATTSG